MHQHAPWSHSHSHLCRLSTACDLLQLPVRSAAVCYRAPKKGFVMALLSSPPAALSASTLAASLGITSASSVRCKHPHNSEHQHQQHTVHQILPPLASPIQRKYNMTLLKLQVFLTAAAARSKETCSSGFQQDASGGKTSYAACSGPRQRRLPQPTVKPHISRNSILPGRHATLD